MTDKTHIRYALIFFAIVAFFPGCVHKTNDIPVQVEAKISDICFDSMHGSNYKIIPIGVATLLLIDPSEYKGLKLRVSLLNRENSDQRNFFIIGNVIRLKIRPSKIKDNGDIVEPDLLEISKLSEESADGVSPCLLQSTEQTPTNPSIVNPTREKTNEPKKSQRTDLHTNHGGF